MLGTLDDCPEHLLQYGDVDGDAHGPRSVPTSPARHSGAALLDRRGSSSLPGSPLKNRTALGSSRKPPLSPGKPLQVNTYVRFHNKLTHVITCMWHLGFVTFHTADTTGRQPCCGL